MKPIGKVTATEDGQVCVRDGTMLGTVRGTVLGVRHGTTHGMIPGTIVLIGDGILLIIIPLGTVLGITAITGIVPIGVGEEESISQVLCMPADRGVAQAIHIINTQATPTVMPTAVEVVWQAIVVSVIVT